MNTAHKFVTGLDQLTEWLNDANYDHGLECQVARLFSLRLPLDYEHIAGRNVGRAHIDLTVAVQPDLEVRGVYRSQEGVIALREWDEQVLLHEILHAVNLPGATSHDPDNHRTINRIEVALWESGWRFSAAAAFVRPDHVMGGGNHHVDDE